jgi:hypothetical protein
VTRGNRSKLANCSPRFGWFTEGFDTRDLKEAKAVSCAFGLRHSEGRTSMLAAEANNYFFQRPKRAVAIRRDGDDFVVSLMPNDLIIFRNESANALRKLCKGLRWAVVSDTAIASI